MESKLLFKMRKRSLTEVPVKPEHRRTVPEKNIRSATGNEDMKYAFISGIPASGKSYIAAKVAHVFGMQHIHIDDWREKMKENQELKKWVDFFWNQDEEKYWRDTDCGRHWNNLNNQSEAIWPTILVKIKEVIASRKQTIFEGVNILPHLARRDLDFEGVILLGESFEIIFERNKKNPRWGKTEELQRKEVEAFWNCERLKYKSEAETYGFKSFVSPILAEEELTNYLRDRQ